MVRFTRIPSWSYPNFTHRLPEHYYRHVMELKKPSTRVHDRPPESDLLDFKYNDKINRVERIPDMPIEVLYPKEADLGLWGGEGIVKGYIKPRKYFQAGWPRPKYWFPNLKKVVLYSDILDKHFSFVCTDRTLSLIDQYCGLDNYILRSPIQDLKSKLALLLRRKMLLTLAKEEFIDENHRKEMLRKYGDAKIPLEEAEWFGLPLVEALTKHKIQASKENVSPPLKYELSKKLIENLKNKKDYDPEPTDETSIAKISWMDRVKSKFGFKST